MDIISYKKLIDRFCTSVSAVMPGQSPDPDHIINFFGDYIGPNGATYGTHLVAGFPHRDWHRVTWSEGAESAIEIESYEGVAPTFNDGLSSVLHHIDHAMVRPRSYDVLPDGALTITLPNAATVQIERVAFHDVPELSEHRARKAFERIRRVHDKESVIRAFRRIPGIPPVWRDPDYQGPTPDVKPKGEPIVLSARMLAWAVRTLLHDIGIDARQSQSLEITARTFGAANWNQFVAGEKHATNVYKPTTVDVWRDEDTRQAYRFYRTPWAALVGAAELFAEMPDREELEVHGPFAWAFSGLPHIAVYHRNNTPSGRNIDWETYIRPRLLVTGPDTVHGADDDSPQLRDIQKGFQYALDRRIKQSGSPAKDFRDALERRGIKSSEHLQVGDFRFLLWNNQGRPELSVERATQGSSPCHITRVPTHHAELKKAWNDTWFLLDENLAAAAFPGLSDSQAQQVAQFASLHVCPMGLTPGEIPGVRKAALRAGLQDCREFRTLIIPSLDANFTDDERIPQLTDEVTVPNVGAYTQAGANYVSVEVPAATAQTLELLDDYEAKRHFRHALLKHLDQQPEAEKEKPTR